MTAYRNNKCRVKTLRELASATDSLVLLQHHPASEVPVGMKAELYLARHSDGYEGVAEQLSVSLGRRWAEIRAEAEVALREAVEKLEADLLTMPRQDIDP